MSKIVNWILGKQVSCLLYHVFASSNFDIFCNLLESPKFCEKLNKLVFEISKGISMLVLSTMFHYCWIYLWHISCDRFSIVLLIIFEVILVETYKGQVMQGATMQDQVLYSRCARKETKWLFIEYG
jgi:hypothetical protein